MENNKNVIYSGLVSSKEKEIEELKAKITEVLAVCPPTSFPTSPPGLDASTPIQYTSKLLPPVSLFISLVTRMCL